MMIQEAVMAQEKNTVEKYSEAADIGTVRIADDVVALIAAFAAMEVEGIASMAGGLDMQTVSKGGMRKLGKTVKVEVSSSGAGSQRRECPRGRHQHKRLIGETSWEMNRKSLREQIFKLLFRTEFNDFSEMDDQVRFFFESGDMTVSEKDQKHIADKCRAVVDKIPEIDDLLNEKLDGWTVDRLPKVELAILRLGTYEILYDESVPTGVAINEAVELGKKFGEDGSGAFINGVLAGVSGKEKSRKSVSAKEGAANRRTPSDSSISERKGDTYITRRI